MSSERTAEPVDLQSSIAPPVEKTIIGIKYGNSEGLQNAFMWQVLGENTTDSNLDEEVYSTISRNLVS